MSDSVNFPQLEGSFNLRGGSIDTPTATAILVGIALAALVGMRLSFPKG